MKIYFHILSIFNVNEMGSHWVLFLLYLKILLNWPEDGRLWLKHVAKYNLIVIIASCLDVCCVLTVHNILYKFKFDNTQQDGRSQRKILYVHLWTVKCKCHIKIVNCHGTVKISHNFLVEMLQFSTVVHLFGRVEEIFLSNFDVLLTVHLSIILVINQFNAQVLVL